jgi:hypothetical protein
VLRIDRAYLTAAVGVRIAIVVLLIVIGEDFHEFRLRQLGIDFAEVFDYAGQFDENDAYGDYRGQCVVKTDVYVFHFEVNEPCDEEHAKIGEFMTKTLPHFRAG